MQIIQITHFNWKLYSTCIYNHLEIAKFMIFYSNINIDSDNACRSGNLGIVKYLSQPFIDIFNTILYYAFEKGLEIAELLINNIDYSLKYFYKLQITL